MEEKRPTKHPCRMLREVDLQEGVQTAAQVLADTFNSTRDNWSMEYGLCSSSKPADPFCANTWL
jgi:hypothetical protein